MIRNNDATELCIMKGQEGFVVGWQSARGPHGKHVLDTLFVKLDNPPQLVQIPGLPDNVVPIVRNTKTVKCVFPSDLIESIERQQAWVLPNFAMTAHASQGTHTCHITLHCQEVQVQLGLLLFKALILMSSQEGAVQGTKRWGV
jgi:hypothetical protein